MNKKILALLMALLMVLTSVVAFADGDGEEVTHPTTLVITKTYTDASGNAIENVPTETLTFTAKSTGYTNVNGVAGDAITADDLTGTLNTATATQTSTGTYEVTLNSLPEFKNAGVYEFTVEESVAKKIQGVTYDESDLIFNVYVSHVIDDNGNQTDDVEVTAIYPKRNADNLKVGGFTNIYNPQETTTTNGLSITKTVAGNAGDKGLEFTVTVTFTPASGTVFDASFAPKVGDTALTLVAGENNTYTSTITIKHGDTKVITGVPAGATVKVEETDAKGHTATYKVGNATEFTATVPTVTAGSATTVAIQNYRDTDIDTGINTDSMPYIMLMAFVMMIAAAVVLKKRTVNE